VINRKNPTVLSETYSRLRAQEEDTEEDFLTIKTLHKLDTQDAAKRSSAPRPEVALEERKAEHEAYLKVLAQQLREDDKRDKLEQAQKLREKRWALKRKLKEEAQQARGSSAAQVVLAAEPGQEEESEEESSEAEEEYMEAEDQENKKQGQKRKRQTEPQTEFNPPSQARDYSSSSLESYALALLRAQKE